MDRPRHCCVSVAIGRMDGPTTPLLCVCNNRPHGAQHNVTQTSFGSLLEILRQFHPGLPKDLRTLLRTPTDYNIRRMAGSGEYFHFGLRSGLEACSMSCSLPTHLQLQFNIDGLPLFKSSAREFWPILCQVKGASAEPFVVGLYCGRTKPQSLEDFLNEFVADIQAALKNGVVVNGCDRTVAIHCFVCDAPARAFVKNVKGHTGYFGCDKCTQEGDYVENRMTFPRVDAPLRTDQQFECQTDEDHHRGSTPLLALGFGLVSGFALDYMHLVCLGVTRKLLMYWLTGPIRRHDRDHCVASRLSATLVSLLSQRLVALSKFIPKEFARKPRPVADIDRWKATEFRTFLLYVGPVVLRGILPDRVYKHFLLLSAGITILCSAQYCVKFNNFANQLLTQFVQQCKEIYSPSFLVYNVHCLVHLAADVKRFGPLDTFSSFPFENQLRFIKRHVRKGAAQLPQAIRRIAERRQIAVCASLHDAARSQSDCCVSVEHAGGPVTEQLRGARQFLQLRLSKTCLSVAAGDNCIAVKGIGPMLVRNIVKVHDSEVFLLCETFQRSNDMPGYPFPSASIGCVSVSGVSRSLEAVRATTSFMKCVCLPDNNPAAENFVIFPLFHNTG